MSYNAGKNWQKKQAKKMLNMLPNYTDLGSGVGFFTNPNPDKKVKESTKLNDLAKECEKLFWTHMTRFDDYKVGFELNPMTFSWEYTVDLFNQSRLVMSERKDGDIDVWMYFGNPNKMLADNEATLKYESTQQLASTVSSFIMGALATEAGQKFDLKTA